MLSSLFTLLVALAVTVAVFVVLRQFVLWYFRINETLAVLKSIDASLKAKAEQS